MKEIRERERERRKSGSVKRVERSAGVLTAIEVSQTGKKHSYFGNTLTIPLEVLAGTLSGNNG